MTESRTPELQKQQILSVVDAMLEGRDAEAKLALKDLFHGDSSNVALNFERLQLIKGGSGLFAGLASAFGKDPEAIEKEKEEKRKEMAMLLTLTVLSNPPMRTAPPPVQKEPEFEVIVGPLEDLGPDYVPEVAAATVGTVTAVAAGKYLMDNHKTKTHLPEADDADKDKKRKNETETEVDKDKDKKTNKTDPDSGKDQKSKTPDAEKPERPEHRTKHGDVDAPGKPHIGKPTAGWIGIAFEVAGPVISTATVLLGGEEKVLEVTTLESDDSNTMELSKQLASESVKEASQNIKEIEIAHKEGGIGKSAKVVGEKIVGKERLSDLKQGAGFVLLKDTMHTIKTISDFRTSIIDGAKSTYEETKKGNMQEAAGTVILSTIETVVGKTAADYTKAMHHDIVDSAVDGIEWAAKKAHDLTSPHKTDPPKTQTADAEKLKDHGTASGAQAHEPDNKKAEQAQKTKSDFASAAAHPDSEQAKTTEPKTAAPAETAKAEPKHSPETSKKAFAAAATGEKPEAATAKVETPPVHVAKTPAHVPTSVHKL